MTSRARWGRAGQRLTPMQAAQRHGHRRAETAAAEVMAQRQLERARALWLAGDLVPYRITQALDLHGLHGPDVDARCGAREPDVDRWEAGQLYPAWEQVLALAALVDVPPMFLFRAPDHVLQASATSMQFHQPGGQSRRPAAAAPQLDLFAEPEPAGPVLDFTRAALAEAAARYGVRPPPANLRTLGGPR